MSAVPRNVYKAEMTLRILTAAEYILFWLTRQSSIFQIFLLLTLNIAKTDLFTQAIIIWP